MARKCSTAVVIVYQLSSKLYDADCIAVIKDGVVIERSTHAQSVDGDERIIL